MKFIFTAILVFIVIGCGEPAYANSHLTETRYCGEPSRHANGSIKRNRSVVLAFESLYPLPPGYDRSKWQIDHVIPLAVGGCDAVHNMQWLPESIKTCPSDDCKDRWERDGIYPKRRG